ncbi:MAG: methionine/alanine import family NSS transporter small subunit [Dermatophilaceae bacterium]|nr:methionine/alanine import family NSS transporter small subunit [Intrasporangiaceae bacterium]
MSTSAILMMMVAMIVVWGGLAVAIIAMMRGTSPGDREIHRDL